MDTNARASETDKQLKVIATVAVMALAFWYFFGGGVEQQSSADLQTAKNQMASDYAAQYEIAKKGGDVADICGQAQLAAASFLQSQDEANYKKWKAIESKDCAKLQ